MAISPHVHGFIDYGSVAVFALAPSALGLTGLAATLSLTLACVHLLMTLLTDFPLAAAPIVPFAWHGGVELVVGLALVFLPFALGFSTTAVAFFAVMGVALLTVYALTPYKHPFGQEVPA